LKETRPLWPPQRGVGLREPNLGKTNLRVSLAYLLGICFFTLSRGLVSLLLTLTRLVVVFIFVNFSFALFTPPLGDYHAQRTEHMQKAHRTVYRTCPVHHRTAKRPHQSELQRSEPNGRLTWLAHRTVSGGAPDCPVRHATDNLPTTTFGGWGYKYPNHPTIHFIHVFTPSTHYKSYNIQF
jgi:hypothetical protein